MVAQLAENREPDEGFTPAPAAPSRPHGVVVSPGLTDHEWVVRLEDLTVGTATETPDGWEWRIYGPPVFEGQETQGRATSLQAAVVALTPAAVLDRTFKIWVRKMNVGSRHAA